MSKTTSGSGQKLYKFAKTIIPGGNQLLSKRPEQFFKKSGRHITKVHVVAQLRI